ncbi:MAG: hypothetical protein WDO24_12410 [Pseudomonadota bacterium]
MRETFTSRESWKGILIGMFGIVAGNTVNWFTWPGRDRLDTAAMGTAPRQSRGDRVSGPAQLSQPGDADRRPDRREHRPP